VFTIGGLIAYLENRLVVQRQRKQKGEQLDIFDGEYTYRCILTNDWDMTDERSYNTTISHTNLFGNTDKTTSFADALV